ncbi:unnamed protein product, partial [Mesorhabditis belari]|uniref:Uncharacterized protein n=1 Tax=Mesorhabditis belari TaxID=2138241 RepID=A0AAF3EBF8_9BILA
MLLFGYMLVLIGFIFVNADEEFDIELLSEECDCRDWYGVCRKQGAEWLDENVWMYNCSSSNGANATFVGCMSPQKELISTKINKTVEGFWHACDEDDLRIRYEQEPRCLVESESYHVGSTFRLGTFQWICLDTGRWITGCFYKNETNNDVLLRIGETGYNGLIKHVCDRFVDYPGRVQYYAEVRDDVHVKHPTNKGVNQNFPPSKEELIQGKVNRWLHENSAAFVSNGEQFGARIRYLPASRSDWTKK